jgi:hypothetical protein
MGPGSSSSRSLVRCLRWTAASGRHRRGSCWRYWQRSACWCYSWRERNAPSQRDAHQDVRLSGRAVVGVANGCSQAIASDGRIAARNRMWFGSGNASSSAERLPSKAEPSLWPAMTGRSPRATKRSRPLGSRSTARRSRSRIGQTAQQLARVPKGVAGGPFRSESPGCRGAERASSRQHDIALSMMAVCPHDRSG